MVDREVLAWADRPRWVIRFVRLVQRIESHGCSRSVEPASLMPDGDGEAFRVTTRVLSAAVSGFGCGCIRACCGATKDRRTQWPPRNEVVRLRIAGSGRWRRRAGFDRRDESSRCRGEVTVRGSCGWCATAARVANAHTHRWRHKFAHEWQTLIEFIEHTDASNAVCCRALRSGPAAVTATTSTAWPPTTRTLGQAPACSMAVSRPSTMRMPDRRQL